MWAHHASTISLIDSWSGRISGDSTAIIIDARASDFSQIAGSTGPYLDTHVSGGAGWRLTAYWVGVSLDALDLCWSMAPPTIRNRNESTMEIVMVALT